MEDVVDGSEIPHTVFPIYLLFSPQCLTIPLILFCTLP